MALGTRFRRLPELPAAGCYTAHRMLSDIMESGRRATDAALDRLIPPETAPPASIHKAMRHSTFAGGKRLRPILCMEAAQMVADGLPQGVADLGAAIEMLHTYSLIHDDLPALDNDDLRRGRPTCHVVFGDALAILAGDALQTQAYQVIAGLGCPGEARIRIVAELARATGTVGGMIGGQVMDLEAERKQPDAAQLEQIHRAKTGALITAALVTGGIYSGGDDAAVERIRNFGRTAGLAFQIADDVLDVTQSSQQLGKTAGKDAAVEKATYPALFGVERSMQMARDYARQACAYLDAFGARGGKLKELAHYLVEREK